MSRTDFYSVKAGAALAGRTLVKFSANAREVLPATAPTDLIAGIVDVDAQAGQMADVAHGDLFEVRLGGTVAAGEPLMCDAQSRAIKAAKGAAGSFVTVIGFALSAGVENDIIPVRIAFSVIAG